MKPSPALVSLALATAAQACVKVHFYYQGDLFTGDVASIQAYDNGVLVCQGGASQFLSSDQTNWCLDDTNGCNAGYSVCVTQNGASGTYTNANTPYSAALTSLNIQSTTYDCECLDSGCIKCPEAESCLWDANSSCADNQTCNLCDYRADCSADPGV